MTKNFKNFIKHVQEEKLSTEEKDSLRYRISEFISMSPIRGKIPEIGRVKYLSIFTVKHFAKATSLVLIFAIVIGGSGVSYAASNALPGDALYTIKVNVNEGIEGALATTPKEKLVVESKKVERRLEEAQILVKENKLTPANKKIVETKLDEHLGNISKQIEEAKKDGDVGIALETTANLTPVLETHKQILEDASVKESQSNTPETNENETDALIAKVDDSIEKVQGEENAIIASLPDTEMPTPAVATTMAITADNENPSEESLKNTDEEKDVMTKTSPTPEEIAEKKETEKAERQIQKIKNNLSDVVEERIKIAQEKIVTIKKEILADKLEAQKKAEEAKEAEELTKTISEKLIATPAEIPSLMTMKVTDEQAEIKEAPVEEKVITPEFDPSIKVIEADRLIGDAKDLFNQGRFKEALEIAQEVNKIASEIETHRKLKALEIAQAQNLNQTLKASASNFETSTQK